jgi:hypothetical protein
MEFDLEPTFLHRKQCCKHGNICFPKIQHTYLLCSLKSCVFSWILKRISNKDFSLNKEPIESKVASDMLKVNYLKTYAHNAEISFISFISFCITCQKKVSLLFDH